MIVASLKIVDFDRFVNVVDGNVVDFTSERNAFEGEFFWREVDLGFAVM